MDVTLNLDSDGGGAYFIPMEASQWHFDTKKIRLPGYDNTQISVVCGVCTRDSN